jgi:2-methylcitrate dehydratase PrpD
MSITPEQEAIAETNIRSWPSKEALRNNTRTWTIEMFIHADSRIDQQTPEPARASMRAMIAEFKAERAHAIEEERRERKHDERNTALIDKLAEVEAERKRIEDERHAAVIERLNKIDATVRTGTETHWTVLPNYRFTKAAAIFGVISVVVGIVAIFFSK